MFSIKSVYQFVFSIGSVIVVFSICILFRDSIYYRSVGYIMLFLVSILAMLFGILPVLTAAVLSAFSWAFFFLKPIYSINITNSEDKFLMFMYFSIAMINIILTNRIRKIEKIAQEKKENDKLLSLYNTLLNSLSHELKTPVASIIGASDVLSNFDNNLTRSNQKILIEEITIASQRLENQINNLLNMSRLESEKLQLKLEWVFIEEMIGNVLNHLDAKHQTKKIQVEIPENLPFFYLDSHIIEQAIYNLLINAIIHTPENTEINIRFKVYETTKKDFSELEIIVSDNGKGIPEDSLKFMFQKFYRVDNSKSGGTGLGLSIVKGFIEAHNGNVFVKNNTFGGAEFTLKIPCHSSIILLD